MNSDTAIKSILALGITKEQMLDPLVNVFVFNLWANLRLYDQCATLDQAQLAAADAGAFGDIRTTLAHIVSAELYYAYALQGQPAGWQRIDTTKLTVAEMRSLVEESGKQLVELAANPSTLPIVERKQDDGEILQIPGTFILTQASHHGNEHRTNITTILAKHDIEHPPLSSWSFWQAQSEAE
jgi:uncharacterized damage-inducible protein DinB